MPGSDKFINRPSVMAKIGEHLLPRRQTSPNQQRRKIFVLHGLGGIGKTQLAANFARSHKATFSSIFWLNGKSENGLKQSLADCARRITGLAEDPTRKDDIEAVVADVLSWLAKPDNTDWLLIIDNFDQDRDQGGLTSVFDVRQYLKGDHGSILITTRLALGQLGKAMQLHKADTALSMAIFEKWYQEKIGRLFFTCKKGKTNKYTSG